VPVGKSLWFGVLLLAEKKSSTKMRVEKRISV